MMEAAMRNKLIAVQLWEENDVRNPEVDFNGAWSVLARLGVPYRFGGRTIDGQVEYLVLNPASGEVVASGRGATSAQAMCRAALTARARCAGALVQVTH